MNLKNKLGESAYELGIRIGYAECVLDKLFGLLTLTIAPFNKEELTSIKEREVSIKSALKASQTVELVSMTCIEADDKDRRDRKGSITGGNKSTSSKIFGGFLARNSHQLSSSVVAASFEEDIDESPKSQHKKKVFDKISGSNLQ